MTQSEADPVAIEILALEHAALVRWCNGDPSGCLDISAPDVVYFDAFIQQRIDGWEALSVYYETIRGRVSGERFEIRNPVVQRAGDLAVLTFNFASYDTNEIEFRWNCTEVYRRDAAGWRIIQTHWSFTAPKK